MIVLDDAFKSGASELDENGKIHIIRNGGGIKGTDLSGANTQNYRIRSYYS